MSSSSNAPSQPNTFFNIPLQIRTRAAGPARNNATTNAPKDPLKSIAHGRIRKHKWIKPQQAQQAHWTLNAEERVAEKTVELISAEQRDRAVTYYKKLKALPLLGLVPRVRLQNTHIANSATIELVYPTDSINPLIDRICRGYPQDEGLSQSELRDLRHILTRDIETLYDAHIPYKPNVSTMSISWWRSVRLGKSVYKPWVDAFDLDKDSEDESIPWSGLKEETINSANAQLDVVGALSVSWYNVPRHLHADLEPDIAVDILETSKFYDQEKTFVILRVSRYSSKLGRFMAQSARRSLRRIPSRATALTESQTLFVSKYHEAVAHVLQLIDTPQAAESAEQKELVKERAALLIVYASLLEHLHAKTIKEDFSMGILAGEKTPEMYKNSDQFQLVADANRRSREAFHSLRTIDYDWRYFYGDWYLDEATPSKKEKWIVYVGSCGVPCFEYIWDR
ncbi:hypothetical protein F5Y01DRAFT_297098 [Xylaria sp. FL0043]|nr:hypothetical protein F5Y01DRAFT_297098 [Xylaria sp. FL0043]